MRALAYFNFNTMSYRRAIQPNSTVKFYKKEAKKLLKQYREKNALALELFESFHPQKTALEDLQLTDAQLVIARHYGQHSWAKLIKVVESNTQYQLLKKAFQDRDKKNIRQLLNKYKVLSGRLLLRTAVMYNDIELVKYLYQLGARDIQDALGQSIYNCAKEITDFLVSKGGNMEGKDRYGLIGLSACETYNLDSLKFTLSYRSKPVPQIHLFEYFAMLATTYMRNAKGKRACMEELVSQGLELEDTPINAFHRGRIDLLETHLKKDPSLVHRRFSIDEIYRTPNFMDPTDGLHLTPLNGTTLLHMAMEFDEQDMMKWLVKNGADVNATSTIDEDGFGGHTPLFHTTVTFIPEDSSKAAFLLEHGANPNHRCSIRKQLKYTGKRHLEDVFEYKNVTPLSFAEQWHGGQNNSPKAIELIKKAGGTV